VPGVSFAFIAWAVGSSRNRTNWQITILKRMRNVLRLITTLTWKRRDVSTLDPRGKKRVFMGCAGLNGEIPTDDLFDTRRNNFH